MNRIKLFFYERRRRHAVADLGAEYLMNRLTREQFESAMQKLTDEDFPSLPARVGRVLTNFVGCTVLAAATAFLAVVAVVGRVTGRSL